MQVIHEENNSVFYEVIYNFKSTAKVTIEYEEMKRTTVTNKPHHIFSFTLRFFNCSFQIDRSIYGI